MLGVESHGPLNCLTGAIQSVEGNLHAGAARAADRNTQQTTGDFLPEGVDDVGCHDHFVHVQRIEVSSVTGLARRPISEIEPEKAALVAVEVQKQFAVLVERRVIRRRVTAYTIVGRISSGHGATNVIGTITPQRNVTVAGMPVAGFAVPTSAAEATKKVNAASALRATSGFIGVCLSVVVKCVRCNKHAARANRTHQSSRWICPSHRNELMQDSRALRHGGAEANNPEPTAAQDKTAKPERTAYMLRGREQELASRKEFLGRPID